MSRDNDNAGAVAESTAHTEVGIGRTREGIRAVSRLGDCESRQDTEVLRDGIRDEMTEPVILAGGSEIF